MTTLLIGIAVALLILGPLIILHEFGHYFAARLSGVRPLEFGFGFPPRITGFWTGATRLKLNPNPEHADFFRQLEPGMKVTVAYREDALGDKHVFELSEYQRGDEAAVDASGQVLVGQLKSIGGGEIVIKDMLWSLNWLPFGGFVRLRGEENPAAKDSLATKSAGIRAFVLLAGIAVKREKNLAGPTFRKISFQKIFFF